MIETRRVSAAGDRAALIRLEHQAVVLLGAAGSLLEFVWLEQGRFLGQQLLQAFRGFTLRLVQLATVDAGIVRSSSPMAQPRWQRPRWR